LRVVLVEAYQPANTANPFGLLGVPGERRCCGPAEKDDEFSALHSITSSAPVAGPKPECAA
jgi:hypothetical protein